MTTPPIIPPVALAQHIAVLGKTGSGKTSTAKLAIEQVVADGSRVCILDPIKSDWWGLTSSVDGKRPGLPFQILGGPHKHVEIGDMAGKTIADLVAKGALPLSIVDMAEFRPGGLSTFFTDFAEVLLRKMRGVLYLVLEEAHLFAPKERSGIGNENMAIHWAKMLATAGRSKGIRLVLVTQRTQSLHNALLGSCDTMIAHRLTAPADQKPVNDWLKANVEASVARKVADSLSSLPTGTGWLCSGEAQLFEKIAFPRIATFDNTATPTGDMTEWKVATAAVDVEALRALIGSAAKEAEGNDPKLLKKRIAELEAEVRKVQRTPAAEKVAVEQEAFARGEAAGADRALRGMTSVVTDMATAIGRAVGACADTKHLITSFASLVEAQTDERASALRPAPKPVPPQAHQRPERPAPDTGSSSSLSGPQLKLLEALAWWSAAGHDQPLRPQVAAIIGWKITSGHLKNVIGSLRTAGLVAYPGDGRVTLTDEGRAAAPEPDLSMGLHDGIRSVLTGPQRQVFDVLLDHGQITRHALAEACGWEPTSGHLKNVIGSMRTLEIVAYPESGVVVLQDWVTG